MPVSLGRIRAVLASAGLFALMGLLGFANASPIDITRAVPGVEPYRISSTAQISSCSGNNVTYYNCVSRAFLTDTRLSGDNAEFSRSFAAWNNAQAVGQRWTLANGGVLPGGTLQATTFLAEASQFEGGLKLRVYWNYTGADKSDYLWTQGLRDNYLLNGAIVDPFYEMDVSETEGEAPPLYPFQYGDRHFYDNPTGPWPNAFFVATTFLGKVDRSSRTLTIYEGFEYGFGLSAAIPVPASFPLFLLGIGFLGWKTARQKSVGSGAPAH